MHEIDAVLKEHPGALVTTPACAGCGRITIDLRRTTASRRVCGTCAARDGKGTCARCGQPKRIYARRPEGGICSDCYDKDEQVVTECSGCGRKRRAATRMPDGSARCQWAKRDWAAYVGQRTADDRRGIGSRKLANPTR